MKHSLCVFALLFLSLGFSAQASVVYVNQNAAGTVHDGTSWTNAYLTITEALASATSGDEVWVAAGTYQEALAPQAGVALYGGFAGVETERGQRDWRVNRSVVDGHGRSDPASVACQFRDTVVDGFTIRRSFTAAVAVTGSHATVSNNTIAGSKGHGVSVTDGTATITGNVITSNGAGIYLKTAGASVIINNTIAANSLGISITNGTVVVANNTVAASYSGGVSVSGGTATIVNNIVAHNDGYGVKKASAAVIAGFGHNDLFGNPGGDYSGFTPPTDQGNLTSDPKLANPYHDFHIQPDSPCVDAGDDASVSGTTDIDRQPRIQGARVDIGADESDGTQWAVPTTAWHVSPSGDDSGDGQTWVTAKKTISAALAAARARDAIWVAAGTYSEQVAPPMGVSLYGGFNGTETVLSERDWRANRSILDGMGALGIVVQLSYSTVLLDGLTIQNGDTGVYISMANVRLSNNNVAGNVVGVLASGNSILDNNVITGNSSFGVNIPWAGTVTLTGNTIVRNGTGVALSPTSNPPVLTNNIVANNTAYGVRLTSGSVKTFSCNDVYGNAEGNYFGYAPPVNQGNLRLDPRFVDLVNGDFHLLAGSPCIDAGLDSAVAGQSDYDGQPRIHGAHVDIGAFEFRSGGLTFADAAWALRIAGGLAAATSGDLARLSLEPASAGIGVLDAIRIARKADGIDGNP